MVKVPGGNQTPWEKETNPDGGGGGIFVDL